MKSVKGSFRPLAPPLTVSVIICTRNRPREMTTCLQSLLRQDRLPDEIVVVDSSDADALDGMLNRMMAGVPVRYRFLRSAPGLTLQRNLGIRTASGAVLIFLDDDVVLDPGYITGILDVYERDTEGRVAGVQGSFVGVKSYSHIGLAFRRFFMLPGFTGLGKMQASGFPSLIALPSVPLEVDMLCGGNTSYRREVFEEFTFNEDFHGYGYMEDDDFSFQIGQKYVLMQTPAARLQHFPSPTARDKLSTRQQMDVRNHWLFFRKRMPQTIWNVLAFVWSELGATLDSGWHLGWEAVRARCATYVKLVGQVRKE